jgi:hypothetical protein
MAPDGAIFTLAMQMPLMAKYLHSRLPSIHEQL